MISHHPVIPPISAIHVMTDYGLLSASTDHCIVGRSFPFRNEVLKGYLHGTGIPPGLGHHLPDTNFMPNISACALASDGTTAKVIWGRQDGSLIIVSHTRTMSRTQSPAHILTSSVQQEHEGAVLDGTWAADSNTFVTAGADGRIKVWVVSPFGCAWTSDRHLSGHSIDPILKVSEDLTNGLVVAASRSGDIIIFSGFDVTSLGRGDALVQDIQKLCVPVRTFPTPIVQPTSVPQPMEISALYFQAPSPTRPCILACYLNTSQFYRCSIDLLNERVDIKTFGNAAFGAIRCIQPAFSNDPAEPSFVLTGTQLGFVGIYDWNTAPLSSDPYPVSRYVDVFSDAQITSLALNPFVIVAGSSRGRITVLDLLTLETLRSFPVTNDVNNDVLQIELVGDLLVANVGSRVLAWSADHFVSGGKNSARTKGKGKQGGHKKWFSKYHSGP
jgi:WD40 repeat protein